ncbi:MAG: hypothetical protein WC002_08710, partial [Candidatus Muiribacteriota bacterium]
SAMINVNGEWKNYAKVEIELKTKVITTALLMYEKRKVTFEVYRAPKGFFSWLFNGLDFDWELHGTCYLFKEFPASTQEIIPPNFLMNL